MYVQFDASTGHAFGIFMNSVGALSGLGAVFFPGWLHFIPTQFNL